MTTVLVTGATGTIGQDLVGLLAATACSRTTPTTAAARRPTSIRPSRRCSGVRPATWPGSPATSQVPSAREHFPGL
jgi:uncharacterized protein YbjT (DUF2867 family)